MDKSLQFLRSAIPPWVLIVGGFIWGAFADAIRAWVLDKIMHVEFIGPLLLVAVGTLWLYYVKQPRFEIVCEPSVHPFRQEWDDAGGHQTLFRVGVHNKSRYKGVNKATVQITSIDPFAMQCIPARLLLMNEDPSVREFFLPASGTQYVDVVQQSQPSGDAFLWHVVKNQPIQLPATHSFTVQITAFGDNTDAVSKNFQIVKQGTAFAFRPI